MTAYREAKMVDKLIFDMFGKNAINTICTILYRLLNAK